MSRATRVSRSAQPLCRARLLVTPWAGARQAPLSMGFSRQEDGSGLPCPLPGDLSNPGTKPGSPALQADSLPRRHWESPEQNHYRAQVGGFCCFLFFSTYEGTRNLLPDLQAYVSTGKTHLKQCPSPFYGSKRGTCQNADSDPLGLAGAQILHF